MSATACEPLEIMALLPEIAGNPVDRYGNVIRHRCHNRPQWNRHKDGSNCVLLNPSAVSAQDDGQKASRSQRVAKATALMHRRVNRKVR
jgi:hypothetical protein